MWVITQYLKVMGVTVVLLVPLSESTIFNNIYDFQACCKSSLKLDHSKQWWKIITQLPTSCATETYVTKSASQEMPGQGSKYKIPPTSSVGQPRLHHYSGFPPLFSVSSHIRPSSPTTPFPTLCISFRQLLRLHGSSKSQQTVCPENKGTIVPFLGYDAEDEIRLPQPGAKEEEN